MPTTPPIQLDEAALYLWVAHDVMRESSTKSAVAELGEIAPAYSLALGVLASAAKRVEGKFGGWTTKSSRRGSILAGFIIGLTLVEQAILGGFTAQASALIRQELEAIAALEEIRKGCRTERRTPNVRHVPSVPGRFYNDLSKAAHFSDTATLRSATVYRGEIESEPGHAEKWLLSPQHVPETTRRLFGMHTLLLLHLTEHQALDDHEVHGLESTAENIQAVSRALQLLKSAGIIEVMSTLPLSGPVHVKRSEEYDQI